ncbi:hypothetical protein DL93DRAFT_805558 [Clavulina sp. PMI_390]|nr:hypothetical protein DL93DRAFT_805558 [Clavulina sp. PMI_390]
MGLLAAHSFGAGSAILNLLVLTALSLRSTAQITAACGPSNRVLWLFSDPWPVDMCPLLLRLRSPQSITKTKYDILSLDVIFNCVL